MLAHIDWDHTGNLASLPRTVELMVGPEIKDRYMPGWPTVPDSYFRETDVAGRKITGLEADDFTIEIGGLRAHDYFPDTFIFIAADSVHLEGEIRPTEALRLPDVVNVPGIVPQPCPGEQLLEIHPRGSRTLPYLSLDPRFPGAPGDAEKTIESVEQFDADDRVLVVFYPRRVHL